MYFQEKTEVMKLFGATLYTYKIYEIVITEQRFRNVGVLVSMNLREMTPQIVYIIYIYIYVGHAVLICTCKWQ